MAQQRHLEAGAIDSILRTIEISSRESHGHRGSAIVSPLKNRNQGKAGAGQSNRLAMKRRRSGAPALKLRPFVAAASAASADTAAAGGQRRPQQSPLPAGSAGGGFTRAAEHPRRAPHLLSASSQALGGGSPLRLSGGFGRASDVTVPLPMPGALLPPHAAERYDDDDQPVLEHPAVVVGMANYGTAWRGASTGVVRFVREPDNEHDPHALMVTIDDARMGYLPRQVAHALSAFVDSGEVSLQPLQLTAEQLGDLTALDAPVPTAFPVALCLALACSGSALEALRERLSLNTAGGGNDDVDEVSPKLPPPPTVRSAHCAATPGLGVLSLFSGISADLLALRRAGISCRLYTSSEVDPAANAVVAAAFANDEALQRTAHLELGDVRHLDEEYLRKLASEGEIDLVIGGSPCQDLSRMAGPDRQGLQGPSSCLFWE